MRGLLEAEFCEGNKQKVKLNSLLEWGSALFFDDSYLRSRSMNTYRKVLRCCALNTLTTIPPICLPNLNPSSLSTLKWTPAYKRD